MTRDADGNFSDLITLEDACKFFLHGKVTVATLRAEHKAQRLEIYRIGRRDFTTLSDLKDMQKRCRVEPPAQRLRFSESVCPKSSVTPRNIVSLKLTAEAAMSYVPASSFVTV